MNHSAMIETSFIDGAAGRIEFLRQKPEGAARGAVLLVHGAWHGAWCWAPHFLPAFAAKGLDVGALSLRGHGESEGRVRWASVGDYVADVRRAAQAMGDPVVIGHSMGGFVTQHYARRHAVKGFAMLASAPPRGPWRLTLQLAGRQPLTLLKTLLTLDLFPVVSDRTQALDFLYSCGPEERAFDAYVDQLQSESFRVFNDMLLNPVDRSPPQTTPRAVFGAEHDHAFPAEDVEKTAAFHGVAPRILAGASHMAMLDRTHAASAAAICDWLDEVF